MPSARDSREREGEREGCFFKGKQLAPQVQRFRGQSVPTPIIAE
jgi:hypothetical protein